jgi:dCTP deaminase
LFSLGLPLSREAPLAFAENTEGAKDDAIWTKERVELNLKGKVAARVEGKSGLARLGLAIHVTAPTIHAGFVGTIQLEMINHGPMHIKLRIGMAICQIIFEATKGVPAKAYKGQFSGQRAR